MYALRCSLAYLMFSCLSLAPRRYLSLRLYEFRTAILRYLRTLLDCGRLSMKGIHSGSHDLYSMICSICICIVNKTSAQTVKVFRRRLVECLCRSNGDKLDQLNAQ